MNNSQPGGLGIVLIVLGVVLASAGGFVLLTSDQFPDNVYRRPDEPETPAQPTNAATLTTNEPVGVRQVLQEELEKQQEAIEAARKKVDELRKELGARNSRSTTNAMASIRQLEASRVETEARLAQKQTILDKLKAMEPAALRTALPNFITDAELSRLLVELDLAQKKLDAENGSAESRKEAQRLVDDLNRRINDRITALIARLNTEVDFMKTQVEGFKAEIERTRDADIAAADRARPYTEAVEDLEKQQRFGELLSEQLASEKEEPATTRASGITVERALPSRQWNFRNRSTGIAALVFGVLMAGAGIWTIKS